MGMPISELKNCTQIQIGKWRCDVPRPHSAFDTYIVQGHPSTGVCWVKGMTPSIDTNSFGSQLRSKVDEIAAQLNEVYGKGNDRSFLMSGSIWTESEDWMMSLLKEERYYSREWPAAAGTPLPNHLKTIYLFAKATQSSKGYVGLEYAFENEGECEKAIKAEEKGAL